MNLSTLCDKLELQPQIKKRVLSFIADFDFETVDHLQRGYFVYQNMNDALAKTQSILGDDEDGIKILSCMLRAALEAYGVYQEKGISSEIFFSTMRCFPRFITETYNMTGEFRFDRYWWTTRQAGCHLFRIGALEYEMKHTEYETAIAIHIPSDADLSPPAVDKSLHDANEFFAKHYPSMRGAEFRCHSWLLDRQLRGMLGNHSNIINFQDRFEIVHEGEAGTEFLQWLFQTKSTNYNTLPENTSLQINAKKHLLAGGVIRNAYGRIKDAY